MGTRVPSAACSICPLGNSYVLTLRDRPRHRRRVAVDHAQRELVVGAVEVGGWPDPRALPEWQAADACACRKPAGGDGVVVSRENAAAQALWGTARVAETDREWKCTLTAVPRRSPPPPRRVSPRDACGDKARVPKIVL
jgi:hypothetical protein